MPEERNDWIVEADKPVSSKWIKFQQDEWDSLDDLDMIAVLHPGSKEITYGEKYEFSETFVKNCGFYQLLDNEDFSDWRTNSSDHQVMSDDIVVEIGFYDTNEEGEEYIQYSLDTVDSINWDSVEEFRILLREPEI